MRHYLAALAPTVLVGGCSLIYNPSNIGQPPADATDAPMIDMGELEIDAMIDAAPILDADPSMLSITSIAPATIFEGQGTGGSRKALVVLSGQHIIDGFSVTITPSTNITIDSQTRSPNGKFIALELTLAIDTTTPADVPLTVEVNQPGAPAPVSVAGMLTLKELPELTNANLPIDPTVVAAQLYSKIELTGAMTFTGNLDQRLILKSVSSIQAGTIDASGGNAAGTTAGVAGRLFGCAGAAPAGTGGCPALVGGGGGATGSGGGGGGGFGTNGFVGSGGASGGAVGPLHGEAQLARYDGGAADGSQLNRSSGGGGGSTSNTLNGTGGGGGGGGGSIELTAGGNISATTVNVNGGNGGQGNGTLNLAQAGGGGGGSGGVIILRAQGGTISGTFTAAGGTMGPGDAGGSNGGAGAGGRIRWDSPTTAPGGTPAAHRGLTFAADTPRTFTTVNANITVNGHDSDIFDAYVIDAAGADHEGEPMNQTVSGGMKTFTAAFIDGYQQLCVTLRPGTRHHPDKLADTCIELAYLP